MSARKRERRQIEESREKRKPLLAASPECPNCSPVPLAVYRNQILVEVYRRHFCGAYPVAVPLNKFYATLRVRS